MKTMFVIAGRAPGWVTNSVRYAATMLTEEGRVLISLTDDLRSNVELPGDFGSASLMGISPAGFPIWKARTLSALGLRRRQENVVVVVFDEVRLATSLGAAAVARLRGEYVVIQDLRRSPTQGPISRLGFRALTRIAHAVNRPAQRSTDGELSVMFAACGADRSFARLIVDVARSMSAEAATAWHFVIQSTDAAVANIVTDGEPFVISVEIGPMLGDIVASSDIVVVKHGDNDHLATESAQRGLQAIIVGHPLGGRVLRRFDGVWLARDDVSSMLVAIEAAQEHQDRNQSSVVDIVAGADVLVSQLRERELQSS